MGRIDMGRIDTGRIDTEARGTFQWQLSTRKEP
jgi:hypothetical protein